MSDRSLNNILEDQEHLDEKMVINVLDDFTATVIFEPPSDGGKIMTLDQIVSQLAEENIVYGVDSELLNSLASEKEYYTEYNIAMGDRPIEGQDPELIYNFHLNSVPKPKMNDDGSVDFHSLNLINNVEKGSVLVELIEGIEGEPGTNINGEEVLPVPLKPIKLPHYGKGVEITEEGNKLIAGRDGQAEFNSNKLYVHDIYSIKGDVGNSTGDIEFNGSVVISGNVLSGFVVKSKKNVEVHGIVEGATIIAGGDIVVKSGIQGMDKARVICKGKLYTKYISNAFVKTSDIIETESILHSEVSSNASIEVTGLKGLISGGRVRANKLINAKVIGSPLGTKTYIDVGVDPDLLEMFNQLKDESISKNDEIIKLDQIITILKSRAKKGVISDEKRSMLEKSAVTKKQLMDELKKVDNKILKIAHLVENTKSGKVRVQDTINAGVIVTIGSQSLIVSGNIDRCTLVLDKAEVRVRPY